MKKNSRWYFIFILILTIFAVLINLAQPYNINFDLKLPFIHKTISVHQKINGINTNFSLGNVHFKRDLSFRKGLDLEGGTTITLKANMNGLPDKQKDNALNSAQTVIERRVNFLEYQSR